MKDNINETVTIQQLNIQYTTYSILHASTLQNIMKQRLNPHTDNPHPLFCFVVYLFFFCLKNISVENNLSSLYLELNLLDQPSPPPPSQYQKVVPNIVCNQFLIVVPQYSLESQDGRAPRKGKKKHDIIMRIQQHNKLKHNPVERVILYAYPLCFYILS